MTTTMLDQEMFSDAEAPVAPDVRFGKPAINEINTEALWEHIESGEDVTEVAEALDLDVDDVRWALAYETRAA
jgi:uncharacterized protein (DUF433 family)